MKFGQISSYASRLFSTEFNRELTDEEMEYLDGEIHRAKSQLWSISEKRDYVGPLYGIALEPIPTAPANFRRRLPEFNDYQAGCSVSAMRRGLNEPFRPSEHGRFKICGSDNP